ncbi:hypothetical protein, partial [Vibrio fluvialis]
YNSVVFSFLLLFSFQVIKLFKSGRIAVVRPVREIGFVFSFLIFLVTIYAVFSNSYDFSRLGSVVSNIFSIFTVILFSYTYNDCTRKANNASNKFDDLCGLIFIVMVIQSLVMIMAMFSGKILDIVQLFQSPLDSARSEYYGGVRGLSLSAAQFFPISALFAISQVFIVRYVIRSDLKYINWFLFSLVILAGLSAGRTSLIGTVIAISYLILNLRFSVASIFQFIKLSVLIVATLFIAYFIASSFLPNFDSYVNNYVQFAFEFYINYAESGELTTSSTNILQRMYWLPPLDTLIFGDGYYSNDLGGTYQGTDGGFMRNILFFGVFGTSVLMFLFLFLFRWIYINSGNDSKLYWLLLILITLLHYKGDVILHLVSVNTLLFVLIITPCHRLK